MIAEKIRQHLELRGMSGAEAARSIGMAEATWWRRLRNPSQFTIGELDQLAAELNVPRSAITG